MTTLGEVLASLDRIGVGTDPDDLAAATCALLRRAGLVPRVQFRIERRGERLEETYAVAIEVVEGARLVASFPIRPMEVGAGPHAALAAIERCRL